MATKDDVIIPAFVSFTDTWHNKPYEAISPTRPELSAQGKNVIVTGGGTGIGKAIAIAFAQAGAASVSILGRREDRLIASTKEINAAATGKIDVTYRITDLTKKADVERSFKSIVDAFGKVSILVSCAGADPSPGLVALNDPDKLMQGFEINVRSAMNALQAFVPLAAPNAVVINISTGMIHMAPMPGMSSYAVSKAANQKLVDYFAAENPNLHVVSIQPGVVSTEINEGTSMKGQDEVELPGQFCVWLASPEASFLKSKYVWANWDVDELKARAKEITDGKLLTWLLEGVPM